MTRALGSLPTDVAMEVLDKFSNANLDGIRSKTGFMLGIVKRLQVNRLLRCVWLIHGCFIGE